MSVATSLTYLVVVGASAGGPRILKEIFTSLPRLMGCVIVVQHMPHFINESLCRTLNAQTDMTVKLAQEGDLLQNGVVYVAPSEHHLLITNNEHIRLAAGEKVNWVCPSIDVTMKSLIKKDGIQLMGVVLTGMGNDGAEGLVYMKSIGAKTITQDSETSIINGMPKEAMKTGKVDLVLSPVQIHHKLVAELGIL